MDLTHHSQPFSPLKLFHVIFHSSNNNFPVITIAIIAILATAFLLIGYYIFVIKCCLYCHQPNIIISSDFTSFEQLEAQKGLEEYIIRSIPIIKFQKVVHQRGECEPGSSKPDPDSSYECAVCLNEFDDGERLRVIPICCHAFHIDCIDIWLQNNASCPLCRSGISPGSILIPNNRLSIFSRGSSRCPNGVCKEEDGFVVIEIDGNNVDEPRLVCNSNECDEVKKIGSIGDEWIDIRGIDEEFRVDQPMRRSISMDLSFDREFMMKIQPSCSDAIVQEKNCSNGSSNKVRKCIISFGYGGSSIKPTVQ